MHILRSGEGDTGVDALFNWLAFQAGNRSLDPVVSHVIRILDHQAVYFFFPQCLDKFSRGVESHKADFARKPAILKHAKTAESGRFVGSENCLGLRKTVEEVLAGTVGCFCGNTGVLVVGKDLGKILDRNSIAVPPGATMFFISEIAAG